jgi:alpha-1,2-mannosyltransferase
LAAGIKLVPGLFVAYFVLTRQWRAAVLSGVTAAVTVGVGFLLLPDSSLTYWSTLGQLQNRVAAESFGVGGLAQVTNQSVLGTLNRLIGPDVRTLWLVVAVTLLVVAAGTVWLLQGRDRPVDSMLVLALAGLLASPVSWTHHWVWTTPLVIVLLVRARTGDVPVRFTGYALAGAWIFTVAVRLVLVSGGVPADPNIARYYRMFGANAYVALGLLSFGFLVWLAVRQRSDRSCPKTADPISVPGAGL